MTKNIEMLLMQLMCFYAPLACNENVYLVERNPAEKFSVP